MDSVLYGAGRDEQAVGVGESAVSQVIHFNWEGLLTAVGFSAAGWAIIAFLVTRLLR